MTVPGPAEFTILGVTIHTVDFPATLALIDGWLAAPRRQCRQVCTVNPEFVVDAQANPEFAAALARADLRVPDGVGILWAARRRGVVLHERVTGSDGILHISAMAAHRGRRVYLLGAAPGVAERTAAVLRDRYPALEICGTWSGSPADEEWPEIHARLEAAQPDILFVAFGHPRQDLWIDRHRAELPAGVAMGVGGAFDFVAGVTHRAPAWVQRLGLEWLYRFVREPWRWWRMMKLPWFVVLVVTDKIDDC